VQAICRSAEEFADLPPWEALTAWLRRFTEYAVTKHALMDALMSYVDRDDPVFRSCRVAINGTGEALLDAAKAAGDVRPDAEFADIGRMVASIATIRGAEPGQIERILELALDGLRYRPA
jgi:transcriptional regulator SbtR-like protein